MKDIDLVKLKEADFSDMSIGHKAIVLSLIEQLEAAQRAEGAAKTRIAEPVAAESRFKGFDWSPCSVEHAEMVQRNPDEWAGYEARLLYDAPAVVLPPEMPERVRDLDNPDDCDHDYLPPAVVYQDGVIDGFNRAIKQAKLLGCQPEKVVKLPPSWPEQMGAYGDVEVFSVSDVKRQLSEANVRWEDGQ